MPIKGPSLCNASLCNAFVMPNKAKYEVHHIIEKRFLARCPQLRNLFGTHGNMPSAILDKAGHQAFTNAWREVLKYGAKEELSPSAILKAARIVYKDAPSLLTSCEKILLLL